MLAIVSIPTVHLRRLEEVLDSENMNIMRTYVPNCQAARAARLLATNRRVLVKLAKVRYVSPSFQGAFRSKRGTS
jgi:hypothetical protein